MAPTELSNPKQSARARTQGWYRYYAGFSPDFVRDALRIVETDNRCLHVLDPWVGAGTTSAIAVGRGHATTGVDINPALVIIAKARLLRSDISESLEALTEEIVKGATRNGVTTTPEEPLLKWFGPSASASLRAIERSIFRILVSPEASRSPLDIGLGHISPLAAFFYVALFRITRSRLLSATTSNPTWVKASVPPRKRAKPSERSLHVAFRETQSSLAEFLGIGLPTKEPPEASLEIQHGSSTSLNIPDASIDVVVTSPPYCTRIDYVASVRPELAVLGCDEASVKVLRHMTLGNPTVPRENQSLESFSSPIAKRFLKAVKAHPSKASTGYYYRYFDTYFTMLDNSLVEMQRVVKKGGSAFLVVQDSFYKEIHLDLPRVASELAEERGWSMKERFDFPVGRTMAVINPRAREHRQVFGAMESALFMERD